MDAVTVDFLKKMKGYFVGVRSWDDLDALWSVVKADADGGWYLYAVGEQPPAQTANAGQVAIFIGELDALLRKDHDHDYCGIVYADSLDVPSFIKVYDPNNLGSSCGSSGLDILPGWVLSKIKPEDLQMQGPLPGNRKRWWRGLFSS